MSPNELMSPAAPFAFAPGLAHGAFLGREDIRAQLIARVQDRARGPLPAPRLREMCRDTAHRLGLGDDNDLGWPADLARLIDTLCVAQNDGGSTACLERLLLLAPAGVSLAPVVNRFLLLCISDGHHGLQQQAVGTQIALFHQLHRLLQREADEAVSEADVYTATSDWQAVHTAIQLQLSRCGRIAPPQEHFLNLAARAVAERDAASAARWAWQAAAHRTTSSDGNTPGGNSGVSAAEILRRWQLGLLVNLMQDLRRDHDPLQANLAHAAPI